MYNMKIGWIDFSDNDKNLALSAIDDLDEPMTHDQLGLSSTSEAFADIFFPITLTQLTRAKYFFIVPYMLIDAAEAAAKGEETDINNIEYECCSKMKNDGELGVIGSTAYGKGPDNWIENTPLVRYWSSIKHIGFFRGNCSVNSYLSYVKNNKCFKKEDWWSDEILKLYKKNWRKDLQIKLTKDEADTLKNKFIKDNPNSLTAIILEKNVELTNGLTFESLSENIVQYIDEPVREEIERNLDLANQFNDMVEVIMTRYNLIISNNKNNKAKNKWDETKDKLEDKLRVDLNKLQNVNNIDSLNNIKSMLFNGQIDEADKKIKERENNLKGNAAKTLNPNENSEWIGVKRFDFRLGYAWTIINDIRNPIE